MIYKIGASGDTLVPVARLPKLHAIHSLALFWYVQDAQWRPSTAQRTHLRCALAVTLARRLPEPDSPCSPTTRVGATQCSEQ